MESNLERGFMVNIKICGITAVREALWLNEADVDYAGFVFYPKSKRGISIQRATEIAKKLNPKIKRVAVTVSPERGQIEELTETGFDIVQAHGKWDDFDAGKIRIPVWRAVNIANLEELMKELQRYIAMEHAPQAVVLDAGSFGSGKTFGWEQNAPAWRTEEYQRLRKGLRERKIRLALAGGLDFGNVKKGIELFEPDIVDVSTGVEADTPVFTGKSREKIEAFCRVCRNGGEDE